MSWDDSIARVLRGPQAAAVTPQANAPAEGTLTRVEGTQAWFTMASYDGGRHEFGPVELGSVSVPPPGATLLVAFPGTGIERPWVIAWRPG